MKFECSSGVCRVTTRAQKRGHRLDQSPASFNITVDLTQDGEEHLTSVLEGPLWQTTPPPPIRQYIAKHAPAKINASRSRQRNNEMSVSPLQHGEAPVIKFSGQSPYLVTH